MFFRLRLGFVLAFSAASVGGAAQVEANELIAQLAKIRLDRTQVYSIRDLTIRRDVFSISFNRGTLAFTEPINGKVTGAVFTGSGEILAILPDRVERQQLHRYTRAALLNERFQTVVLRFTDETQAQILKEHRTRAPEDLDPEDMREVLRWESELQRRGRFLNDRIIADLLGSSRFPLFMAQVEGAELGWFDAIYDQRRDEEVVIEQGLTGRLLPIIWTSFDKRGDAQGTPATAADDKSQPELVSYRAEGPVAALQLRSKMDGERVIQVPVTAPDQIVAVALPERKELPFIASTHHVAVILPEPTKRGQEISLRLTYSADAPGRSGLRSADAVMPASYRNQWIIDGLGNYGSMVSGDLLALARTRLLQTSPEGGSYESLGPVSIGYRLMQPESTEGYLNVLRDKSVWIIHMLRMLVRRGDDDDTVFREMILDFGKAFNGRSVSTDEFRQHASRHAGMDLDWFFDQWVLGTGIPSYRLDYSATPAAGGFAIEGRIEQSGVPETFTMPVPLYADEMLLGRVTVSGDGGAFRFVVKNKPQQIRVDPKGTILTNSLSESGAPR